MRKGKRTKVHILGRHQGLSSKGTPRHPMRRGKGGIDLAGTSVVLAVSDR